MSDPTPIRGQEAVVAIYGLGRVINFDSYTIEVKTYADGHTRTFTTLDVALIPPLGATAAVRALLDKALLDMSQPPRARVRTIDIVFDGPPGPESGRIVEVEDDSGRSISVGEWIERPDGHWALRLAAVG